MATSYDALSDFVNQEADYNFGVGLEMLKRGGSSFLDAIGPSQAQAFFLEDLKDASMGGKTLNNIATKLGSDFVIKPTKERILVSLVEPFLNQYNNPFDPIKTVEFNRNYGSSYSPSKDRVSLNPLETDILGGPENTIFPKSASLPKSISLIEGLFHEGVHGLQQKDRVLSNPNLRPSDWLPRPSAPKQSNGVGQSYWTNSGEVQSRAIATLAALTVAKQQGLQPDAQGIMKEAYVPADYWPEAKVILSAILAGHDPSKAVETYKGGGITPMGNLDYKKLGW
jgi:hypothetical protein